MGDAFHQVAIADQGVGHVVNERVVVAVEARRQPALGDGHADSVGQPLPQRPGGSLDAGRQVQLRVAGRQAAPLAEVHQVFQRQVVAGQVQQAIEQHGAVPGRQQEAVAVEPPRIAGVELHELRPQNDGGVGHAHRQTGVAALGLLHRIHRQAADDVGR